MVSNLKIGFLSESGVLSCKIVIRESTGWMQDVKVWFVIWGVSLEIVSNLKLGFLSESGVFSCKIVIRESTGWMMFVCISISEIEQENVLRTSKSRNL